jgi:hypothetical protein
MGIAGATDRQHDRSQLSGRRDRLPRPQPVLIQGAVAAALGFAGAAARSRGVARLLADAKGFRRRSYFQRGLTWEHPAARPRDSPDRELPQPMSGLACRVWGHRNQNMDTVWLTQLYVLFWIEVGSRRVHLAGCTYRPSGAWVAPQGRNLSSSSTTTRLGRIKASATAALQTDATPPRTAG